MARILTITANPLLNHITDQPVMCGQVNRVAQLRPAAEGKGINVARILQAHGHEVTATGFAGGPSGSWLTGLIQTAGIGADFVATAAPLRVGLMAASDDPAHPTTVFADGFAVSAAEIEALIATLGRHLDNADLVIAAGSVPCAAATDLWARVATVCATAAVPLWLDSYGPAMDAALAAAAPIAVAKPNREEYAAGQGWNRVQELHVTDGPRGVVVRNCDGEWRVRPPPIAQANPIGSGDTYLAALAHAWLSGQDLPQRLAYASAAGAANAARTDICAIGPDDISPLIDQVTISAA